MGALGTAGNSMDVLEQAIGVVQSNVANASTPGYVTQTQTLEASPFDAANNVWGGVQAGAVESARNVYAEQAVWSANEAAGYSTQQSSSLNALQADFDVTGKTGVPGALSALYSSFSAWSANPTDSTARQQVITAAQGFAQSFNAAASSIEQIRTATDQQVSSTVSQINQYSAQIAAINTQIRQGGGSNAGLQTQLYSTLEQLSNLAPISVQTQSDGTSTVLLGGQVPLVIGQNQMPLSMTSTPSATATYPNAAPDDQVLNANGQDVTSLIAGGTLGGLLNFRNSTIPSIIGDGTQQGSLNQLAQGVADRVNTLLTSGQVSAGPPAVSGVPLFSYDATSPTSVADTLSVSSTVTGAQLAAIEPGTPAVANGIASQLAQLADPTSAADMINGQSFTSFYSDMAANVGQLASTASSDQTTQTQQLAQAQNLRAQVSGVSLNDQAALLLQFQNSYQASAQMISTISSMLQTLFTTMESVH